MVKKPTLIYQLKVTLDGIRPPVWRRIQVPDSTTLDELHRILQIVMGWEDYHLHQFTINDVIYADPAIDEWGEWGIQPEEQYKLNQLVPCHKARFRYEYDFGDGWLHTLVVEKIMPPEKGTRYPVCIKGKRACPPEDVGSIWGYQNFLQALVDPDHPEHEMYVEWIGGSFDPEAFDLEAVNASLRQTFRGKGAGDWSTFPPEEYQTQNSRVSLAAAWARDLGKDQQIQAKDLALRRDMTVLLAYLRENKVKGTQATGNLTLKAVREICAQFVDPPTLEWKLEKQVSQVRSESEVWPLFFRHVLASVAGWAVGGPGRLWRLTPQGEEYLAMPAPLQVWLLLDTWWNRVNWAVASTVDLDGGLFPIEIRKLALDHLLDLPEEPVPFEWFANRLIDKAGFVWPIEDQDYARLALQWMIERTVVNPLIDFAVLAADYEPDKILGPKYRDLSAIQLTPLGRGLLRLLLPTNHLPTTH